jgi:glutamate racemase
VADPAMPYGDRDPAHALQRSIRVTEHLMAQGARLIIVACNTATARAIDTCASAIPTSPGWAWSPA